MRNPACGVVGPHHAPGIAEEEGTRLVGGKGRRRGNEYALLDPQDLGHYGADG
jgi:hypothetical protein